MNDNTNAIDLGLWATLREWSRYAIALYYIFLNLYLHNLFNSQTL
ncbi:MULTISPECIES: hypothetical protein [unclassified Moorena]|nr:MULTISPECIES: hypothetical protein [unclassified Moorena]